MDIELGLTKRTTDTKFAPLVALSAYYQQMNLLRPLESVSIAIKMRELGTRRLASGRHRRQCLPARCLIATDTEIRDYRTTPAP